MRYTAAPTTNTDHGPPTTLSFLVPGRWSVVRGQHQPTPTTDHRPPTWHEKRQGPTRRAPTAVRRLRLAGPRAAARGRCSHQGPHGLVCAVPLLLLPRVPLLPEGTVGVVGGCPRDGAQPGDASAEMVCAQVAAAGRAVTDAGGRAVRAVLSAARRAVPLVVSACGRDRALAAGNEGPPAAAVNVVRRQPGRQGRRHRVRQGVRDVPCGAPIQSRPDRAREPSLLVPDGVIERTTVAPTFAVALLC